MGRLTDALRSYEEALRIRRAALGPDHHAVATTLGNIGAVYVAQGDKRRAKESFEAAKRIFIKTFGEDHPDVQWASDWLADL